jgi:splicing factor 1
MSWRNQSSQTGANNIPLGARRRFGGDSEDPPEPVRASRPYTPSDSDSLKRGRSPVKCQYSTAKLLYQTANHLLAEPVEDGIKRRKKRNRWGDATDNKAAGLMGLPTMIMANMTNEQLEAYTLHLRIEEISQKLRINDVVPADGDR